ncbi:MAG: Ser-Thr-rich GPI-anchored membrane family protein, partial [Chloroflexia bacterium]
MTRINSFLRVRTAMLIASLGLLGSAVMLAGNSSNALAATNDTITLTSPNNVTIAESDDYATQVLGDPWDMNDKGDLNWPYNVQNASASGGVWHGNPMGDQNGVVYPVYQNFRNSYSYVGEKDGVNYPVDSNRYSRFWVRMSSDASAISPLWFFKHFTYTPSGNSNFLNIEAGWHIYSVDLRLGGSGGTGNWTQNGPYEGLRFDMPWFHPGNNVQIDWMRLTPDTGQSVNVAWTYQGGASSTVNLYLSNTTNATQNNEYRIASVAANSNSYNWNTTGMASGTYYVHAEMNGAWSSSGPLNVNTAPLARVDAPSQLSGEDYAQAQLAQGWQSCGQFTRFINVQGQQCGVDEMLASPSNNDPEAFWLLNNYSHTIDTNRYHYVNVKFLVAPPAARSWAPFNAGTRLIWQNNTVPHTTNLILAPYNEWVQAGFDMRVTPMIDGSTGWGGSISSLRFDPLEQDEESGQPTLLPANFRIGQSHITSEPISGPGTIVRWTALQGNGTVDIYRDNNKTGYDGTLVAS